MTILILDNYDSFTYNLYQVVQAQTEQAVQVYRNDELSWRELQRLAPEGIILSPGPGHPSQARDFGICRQVIEEQEVLRCPILGICLGHQGIAHVLGGNVIPAPTIQHGKTAQVRQLKPNALFKDLPLTFQVMRYHSWMVDPDAVPACLEIMAETVPTDTPAKEGTEFKPVIMGLAHRQLPVFGVQFHPESVGTPLGAVLLKNFLSLTQ